MSARRWIILDFILTVCVAALACGFWRDNIALGASEDRFVYSYRGQQIQMEALPTCSAVRFVDGSSTQFPEDLLEGMGTDTGGLVYINDISFGGSYIVANPGAEGADITTQQALDALSRSDHVYSSHLVFADRADTYPESYTRFLEPVAAAADIYFNAKRARQHHAALPVFVSNALTAVATAEGIYPSAPVAKTVSVDAEVLSDYFIAECPSDENGDDLVALMNQQGAEVVRRKGTIQRGCELSFRVPQPSLPAGARVLELLDLCQASGLVAACYPYLLPVYSIHYRMATADEIVAWRDVTQQERQEDEDLTAPPSEVEYCYFGGETWHEFALTGDRIGVWFAQNTNEADQIQLLQSRADVRLAESWRRYDSLQLGVAALEAGLSPPQIDGIVDSLLQNEIVQHVSPVFIDPFGDPVLIGNGVYVSFHNDTEYSIIQDRIAALDFSIVRRKGLSPLDRVAYWLKPNTKIDTREVLQRCRALLQYDDVITIEPDLLYLLDPFQSTVPNDPYLGNQWGLDAIGMPNAWDFIGYIPQHSTLVTRTAIIDSGLDVDHPEFYSAGYGYKGCIDYIDGSLPTDDTFGHGTAVAGVLSAITNNGIGIAGVTWNNPAYHYRIADDPYYSSSVITQALYDIIDYPYGASINAVNCSFGARSPSETMEEAILYLDSNDVLVVAGSGNNNLHTAFYPASFPSVLSVGATNENSARWKSMGGYGSNWDETLDLVAPGCLILTTDILGEEGRCDNDYCRVDGTSLATPHATGVAGLVYLKMKYEAFLKYPGNDMRNFDEWAHAALRFSATDEVGRPEEDTPGRDLYMGFGLLNADAAMHLIEKWRSLFMIQDSEGRKVLSFDAEGNCILLGTLSQSDMSITPGCPFEVRSGTNSVAGLSNTGSEWLLEISGTLQENIDGSLFPATPSIVVQDAFGNSVAYLDSDGNLALRGYLFADGDPD